LSLPKYILHIGYGKTGTTGIQRFLAHNRDVLPEQGVVYPDTSVNGSRLYARDHNIVGRALAGRRGWWRTEPEAFFEQFEHQRKKAGAHTVILSGETFLGGVHPWDCDTDASYFEQAAKTVFLLGELLRNATVRVIVYLRRQDHWVESVLNQNIKFGGLVGQHLAGLTAKETAAMYAPRLDYAAILGLWAGVFGAEAIQVAVYEPGQLVQGDAVSDFIFRAGLESKGLGEPDWDPASRNTGLTRDVLAFKRLLNKIPKPKYEERIIAGTLRTVSQEMECKGTTKQSLMDTVTRLELLELYTQTNAEVARTYLGRPDGILFREPWPESTDSPQGYPGISPEAAIEILLRMDHHQKSFRTRLALGRHWLAEKLRSKAPVLHGFARRVRALFKR
jgi:hypothetical protein